MNGNRAIQSFQRKPPRPDWTGAWILLALPLTFFVPLPEVGAHPSEKQVTIILNALESEKECEHPEVCFNRAIKGLHLNRRDLSHLKLLNQLLERYPETFWGARAAFTLGRFDLADQNERGADYLRLAGPLEDIQHYILFFQAQAHRQAQEFSDALASYEKILTGYTESSLWSKALYQKALTLKEAGDCEKASLTFEQYALEFGKKEDAPLAYFEASECWVEMEDPDRALKALRQIWVYYPENPVAEGAGKAVIQIESTGATLPRPTAEELNHRANRLYTYARYREALGDYQILSQDSSSPYWEKATIKLALTNFRLRKYEDARQVLETFLAQSPDSDQSEKAMYWLSRIGIRTGDEALLLESEKMLSSKFPRSVRGGKVLNFIGRFYEDRGNPEKALKSYNRVLDEFVNETVTREALWRIGWMAYREERYEEAFRIFSGHSHDGKLGKGIERFSYWAGRTSENLERFPEAVTAFQKTCYRSQRTYYCQMAKDRLNFLASNPSNGLDLSIARVSNKSASALSHFSFDKPSEKIGRDFNYRAAVELMTLGMNQEASEELGMLSKRYADDHHAQLELSRLLYKAGDYHRSLGILRTHFHTLLKRDNDFIPSAFWERAFALSVVDEIKDQSPPPPGVSRAI